MDAGNHSVNRLTPPVAAARIRVAKEVKDAGNHSVNRLTPPVAAARIRVAKEVK
jgi:hypothetical protein